MQDMSKKLRTVLRAIKLEYPEQILSKLVKTSSENMTSKEEEQNNTGGDKKNTNYLTMNEEAELTFSDMKIYPDAKKVCP